MGQENLVAIAAVEAKSAAENLPEEDVKGRLRAAMEATREHWLVTNESQRFVSAVAGVMQLYPEDSPVRQQLKDELDALRYLGEGNFHALIAIVQQREGQAEERPAPIGIQQIWRDVTRVWKYYITVTCGECPIELHPRTPVMGASPLPATAGYLSAVLGNRDLSERLLEGCQEHPHAERTIHMTCE